MPAPPSANNSTQTATTSYSSNGFSQTIIQPNTATISTNIKGHILIKNILKSKEAKQIQEEAKLSEIATNTPFSQEMMISAWNKYIHTLSNERYILVNTMETRKPVLTDNFVLIQTVDNSFQEKEMNGEAINILNFLRSELKNGFITLKVNVDESQMINKIKTPNEEFNALLEESPAMKNLADEFKLSLEI